MHKKSLVENEKFIAGCWLLLMPVNVSSLLMLYLFIFGRDGRTYIWKSLGEGSRFLKNTAWLIYYLINFTVGYANANILRTVAAMKKVKVSNHIYIKRAKLEFASFIRFWDIVINWRMGTPDARLVINEVSCVFDEGFQTYNIRLQAIVYIFW